MSCDEAAILAFKGVLAGADSVGLLLSAEAGGYGVDQSQAPRAAARTVATSLGYPPSNYDGLTQGIMIGIILDRLHALAVAGWTAGATVQNPRANTYAYAYL